VLGNYPGNTAEADEIVQQDELAAGARGVRNLGPLTAPDTSASLSHWVADQDDLSLLIWFAKPDPEKAAVQAYLFSPWHEQGSRDKSGMLRSALVALRAN